MSYADLDGPDRIHAAVSAFTLAGGSVSRGVLPADGWPHTCRVLATERVRLNKYIAKPFVERVDGQIADGLHVPDSIVAQAIQSAARDHQPVGLATAKHVAQRMTSKKRGTPPRDWREEINRAQARVWVALCYDFGTVEGVADPLKLALEAVAERLGMPSDKTIEAWWYSGPK